jgi:hypothetical protein
MTSPISLRPSIRHPRRRLRWLNHRQQWPLAIGAWPDCEPSELRPGSGPWSPMPFLQQRLWTWSGLPAPQAFTKTLFTSICHQMSKNEGKSPNPSNIQAPKYCRSRATHREMEPTPA